MSSIVDDDDDPLFTPRGPVPPSNSSSVGSNRNDASNSRRFPTEPAAGEAPRPDPPACAGVDLGPSKLTNWGLVGSETVWTLLPGRQSGGKVARTVAGEFRYHPLPGELGLAAWQPSRESSQVYEMALSSTFDPRKAISLADLSETLRARAGSGPIPPDDENLIMLDNAASRVLDVVAKLHARKREAGTLHPEAILIAPGTDGKQVIMPDLGFVWEGSDPDAEDLSPRWLRVDDNHLARFWAPDSPAQRQTATIHPRLDARGAVDPAADIRTLARLFADLLDPESVTPNGIDPVSSHQARVWQVLREAEAGSYTAERLRSVLHPAKTPLSHHFTGRPTSIPLHLDPRPYSTWPILASLAGIAALSSVLIIATYLRSGGTDKKPDATTGKEVTKGTEKGAESPGPGPDKSSPATSDDPAWKALVEKFHKASDNPKRLAALASLADHVVALSASKPSSVAERVEFLELWGEAFESKPRFSAAALADEMAFYGSLGQSLKKVHQCPAPTGSSILLREQSCLDRLP